MPTHQGPLNVDRETGESVGSSISSVPDERLHNPQASNASAQLYDEDSNSKDFPKCDKGCLHRTFFILENLTSTDNASEHSTATEKTGNAMQGFRIHSKTGMPRHSSDTDIRASESVNDRTSCASRSSSVGSQTDPPQPRRQPVITAKTSKSIKRTASSLVISAHRRRSVKSGSVSSTDGEPQIEPSPAKVPKLGPQSQKKDREAWAKYQKETAQQKADLQVSSKTQVSLKNAVQQSPPLPQVYMRQVRKQLKRLVTQHEWEKALELIERRFQTIIGVHDRVLDEVMQEAVQQEQWQAVEQLIELHVARHLLCKVFSEAFKKDQWSWVRKTMLMNSRDLKLNTAALQEAVKVAEEELQVLELLRDLNVECHADESFFEALEKRFWHAASVMVSKQFVTQEQCREACEIVLLEAVGHYKDNQKSGRSAGKGDAETGRLKSDQKRCTDMWSFLYLLAQLRITREPIQDYITQALASNDWMFAKKLAYLLPAESDDGQLPVLFTEAMRRDDWPYVVSRLSPSIQHNESILHAAVARGAWNYAVQIVGKTQKAVQDAVSRWSKLDAVLFLQQCCDDDVMSSAFKMSVRNGDWEYVALLAHPSVKDEYRLVALQEVISQWARVFFRLLMQGKGDSPREDNSECVFTTTPVRNSGSFATRTSSSGYFCWSSSSPPETPFNFSALPANSNDPAFLLKQADATAFNIDLLHVSHCQDTPLLSEKSRPESVCSLDDVFLPEEAGPSLHQYEWKDIRQNGQYLYTLVQLTRCLSKAQGSTLSSQHRELLKDTITRWAQAVKDLLQNTYLANSFSIDDVCCNLLYSVEKKMELMATSTDATSETAWASVPILVTQTINANLAQFALDHTLASKRWDIIQDVLLFALESFTENGRRLIFKQALEDNQWDTVQSLAEFDLYTDQVREAVAAAMKAHQNDLVLFLLDLQQLSLEEIQDVFLQAVSTTQWDLVLPLLERGATTDNLFKDSSTTSSSATQQLEEELSNSISGQQEQPNDATQRFPTHSMVLQLRNSGQLSDEEQWELLQEAVSQQKWHIVAQVIRKCKIGDHAAVHRKLFPEALDQRQWGVIRVLIQRGVKDVPQCYQAYALDLIQQGKWSIVGQVFLNSEEKDEETFSEVLSRAITKQEWSTVVLLIQSGLSEEQRTYLFQFATHTSNWKIVEQLTDKKDSVGYYLSEYAFDIAANQSNWELVCHYVQQGVDIDYQDRDGHTALHLAATQRDKDGVQKLMRLGPDVNIMNDNQITPMHLVAKMKSWDLVKLMIENGGNINLPDHKNITVLRYLLEAGQADILHLAVEQGCDVMADSVKGRTAIHVLLSAGYYRTVMKMVEQGADASATTAGRTLLHFAINQTTLSSMESCLSLCIDLGLSTHQPKVNDSHITRSESNTLADQLKNSPTWMALRNMSVPFKILWMLLESGSSSYFELQLLKSWKHLKEIASGSENGKQKVLYLTRAASNPHSLKHLCRLAISHQMGCKGDRKQRIASLPLPRQMKDYVSFSDVLSVVKYQGKRML
ncbi:hypothetical protein BaRGS_00025712 [Batillaria attramentaria]|uniref:SOCS box domain-containing protein n=1 Tax=Batillaria attramentaria TaxID=370345 RepID=A0ABD0K742_9CAEN